MEKTQPLIIFKNKYNSYNNAVNYNRHIKFCGQTCSIKNTRSLKNNGLKKILNPVKTFLIQKFEKTFIFRPKKIIHPIPEGLKGIIQQVETLTQDGLNLKHYYIPAKDGKKTIVFCHGIKHSNTKFFNVAEFLNKNGYGAFLLEYRGFGKNPGTPGEKGFYKDFDSIAKFLNKNGIKEKDTVLWGFSMGGGVAVEAAKTNKYAGLILNNTFTTMREEIESFPNNRFLLKNKFSQKIIKTILSKILPLGTAFENIKKIPNIKSRTLILHSKNDKTIPYQMSEKLAKACPQAELYISQKGSHKQLGWTEEKILEFLNSLN